VGQVVDDAEPRHQHTVGYPAGLVVIQVVDLGDHRAAEIGEPAQEQLALVRRDASGADVRLA
jgi:hypothetical protein